MPSIELVAVGQVEPPALPPLPFAVMHGPDLESHRGPSPLFQTDFDAVSGWMYHLGNVRCGEPGYEGMFFAYDLLSRRSQDGEGGVLEFDPAIRSAVARLFDLLLGWSPSGLVLFTSDWQFGRAAEARSAPIGVGEFWRRHDTGEARVNALYPIQIDARLRR